MSHSSRGIVLIACLALSACGIFQWDGTVHQASDDGAASSGCGSSGKGSHAEREAKDRQCRADQTDSKVASQQILHDEGMTRPQPW